MSKFSDDFIQYSDKKVKNETKNLALYFILHIFLYIVLLFFLIFFAWYTVFITTHSFYQVHGASMKPTLNSSIADTDQTSCFDAVYVDKISRLRDFDIVVVETEDIKEGKRVVTNVVKRLMAQEGDFITIAEDSTGSFKFFKIPKGQDLTTFSDEEAMLIEDSGENGYRIKNYESWNAMRQGKFASVEVGEQNLGKTYESNFYDTLLKPFFEDGVTDGFFVSKEGLVYVQVPKDHVFCMGDNRGFSRDGRERGFFAKEKVIGRGEFVVYNFNFVNRIWEVVKFYFSEVEKFFAR